MGHWKASWSQTTAYGKEIYFFTVSLRGTELAKVIWHRSAQESSHRVGGGSPVCHVGVGVLGGVAGIQVRPGSTPSPGVSQSSPHAGVEEALPAGVLPRLNMKESGRGGRKPGKVQHSLCHF